MRKLILVTLLMLFGFPVAKADGLMVCLKRVEVPISEVVPSGPHFGDNVDRKTKIALLMRVDCKTEKIAVPSTSAEAKEWVDLALPLDFKTGLTGGSSFYPYVYTPYGYSVEYDLYRYFDSVWNLDPKSIVCKAFPRTEVEKEGTNWCFINLIDSLRNDYKNPKALSPGGQ